MFIYLIRFFVCYLKTFRSLIFEYIYIYNSFKYQIMYVILLLFAVMLSCIFYIEKGKYHTHWSIYICISVFLYLFWYFQCDHVSIHPDRGSRPVHTDCHTDLQEIRWSEQLQSKQICYVWWPLGPPICTAPLHGIFPNMVQLYASPVSKSTPPPLLLTP